HEGAAAGELRVLAVLRRRRLHAEQRGDREERDPAGEGELLGIGVEKRGAEVTGVGDDRGAGGPHQRDRHLAGDVLQRLPEYLDVDHVEAVGGGAVHAAPPFSVPASRSARPPSPSRRALMPVGTKIVVSWPSTIAGPRSSAPAPTSAMSK